MDPRLGAASPMNLDVSWLSTYNVDPRLRMQFCNPPNRDPRTAARQGENNESDDHYRLKDENDRLRMKVRSLEGEMKRLREGREQAMVLRQVKEVMEQNAQLERVTKSDLIQMNEMKSRIGDLIKANSALKKANKEIRHAKSIKEDEPKHAEKNVSQVTTSAVRYAIEEFRKNFEAREREIDQKLVEWQEKANYAMEHINELSVQIERLKEENERLRLSKDPDTTVEPDDSTAAGIRERNHLPFRKRFKQE